WAVAKGGNAVTSTKEDITKKISEWLFNKKVHIPDKSGDKKQAPNNMPEGISAFVKQVADYMFTENSAEQFSPTPTTEDKNSFENQTELVYKKTFTSTRKLHVSSDDDKTFAFLVHNSIRDYFEQEKAVEKAVNNKFENFCPWQNLYGLELVGQGMLKPTGTEAVPTIPTANEKPLSVVEKVNDSFSILDQNWLWQVPQFATLGFVILLMILFLYQRQQFKNLNQDFLQQFQDIPGLITQELKPLRGLSFAKEIQEKDREIATLNKKSTQVEQQLTTLEQEHNSLKKSFETQTSSLEKAKQELQQERQQHTQTKRSLEETEKREAVLRRDYNSLNKNFETQKEALKAKENELTQAKQVAEKATQELRQQFATEKQGHEKTQSSLKKTEQELQQERQQHTQTKQLLETVKGELEIAKREYEHQVQSLLSERFGLVKPGNQDFSAWIKGLTGQKGIWQWLQIVFSIKLSDCLVAKQAIERDETRKVFEVLYLEKLLQGWRVLVDNQFSDDKEMWGRLRQLDDAQWLTRLLRAEAILQTYFAENPQWESLSKHLMAMTSLLEATLEKQMKVSILKPRLLEKVPDDLKTLQKQTQPLSVLKELIKAQIQDQAKQTSDFVIDVEKYGFVTEDTPESKVSVVIYNHANWQ
ncbi:MAG: hypothetical protein BWK78_02555, partial [Thiotrichaceae bacterium IS1]